MFSNILFFACTKTSLTKSSYNESGSGDSTATTAATDTTPYTPGPAGLKICIQRSANKCEQRGR